VATSDVKLRVLNGSKRGGEARSALKAFEQLGFQSSGAANDPRRSVAETEVRYAPGAEDKGRAVLRYIEPAARLVEDDDVKGADVVVASGVFNVRMTVPESEWLGYATDTLVAIDEKALQGWAVNFLTSYSDEDRKRADLFYADPAVMFGWCQRNASRWVSLLHDYELYEFTIGVRRRPD
jgi:hypothetical protein